MRDQNDINTDEYPGYAPGNHSWRAFEIHADKEGIGDHFDDWWPNWVTWCRGYNAAMSRIFSK